MTTIVVAGAFGGPEVLEVRQVQLGPPGPGEVRLEVRAAGVNPVDRKSYSGAFGSDPSTLPRRLGLEAAGVVVEVGPGAEGPAGEVSPGDDVIVYPVTGAYATEIVVPATSVIPKPADLGWEPAAGLLLAGVTAVHTLVATGVGSGDTVLIHGAAGGVGLFDVQLAKQRGARVIGTARAERHGELARLGAEAVEYGPGLADRVRAAAPAGVDAAIDLIGTDEAVDVSLALVADRSRIATIAAFGRGGEAGIKVLGGGEGADPGAAVRSAARLELARLAGAGELEVVVDRTFPLTDAAGAHAYIGAGHAAGKVVLVP